MKKIHPNLSSLDLGLADAILERQVKPDFDHFVAQPFEQAARDYFAQKAQAGQLSFLPERIGSWWDRETEIDVVVFSQSEKMALVGECKWSINPVGVSVLDDLKRKAAILSHAYDLKETTLCLFSRAGYTSALESLAAREKIELLTVDALLP